MKYCLRRFEQNGRRALIWELDDDLVVTGVCYNGFRTRNGGNLLFCSAMRGHIGRDFQADIRSFVPLGKVTVKYDSQINAIMRDVAGGIIADPGEMKPSIETQRREARMSEESEDAVTV